MGKYKQWLHHQEVGARLRDEIAAHEAERERVLKLAPAKQTSLPDPSNPIIAALLGQPSLTKASDSSAARSARNGAATPEPVPAVVAAAPASSSQAAAVPAEAASKITDKLAPASQTSKSEAPVQAPVQKESAPVKPAASAEAPARQKAMTSPMKAVAGKSTPPPAPAEAQRAEAPAQPDTIDPLLEQLLAQAENAPADPLEALNLLASQGPNLTRGDAPLPITTLPTAPLPEPASIGQSALNTLLGESKPTPEPQKRASEPVSGSVAVGVEAIATAEVAARAEAIVRVEKKRSDTDELVASRPTEGYTEPRLIVPQWLKSMELNQNQGGEKAEGQTEEGDNKQRFSVSLPFESEEDMRLHESVERWWQRWRQQS
ncbi:MAG TPA: hypothetical protein VFU69_11855 [Ktedonobacterales bacterium]|nr:hypothetical protein [Ktedonobacterales bacterium]